MIEQCKLKSGNYMLPSELTYVKGRIEVKFPFSKEIQAAIKMMEGPKWHGYDTPPRKVWSIADSVRNRFQLEVLKNNNPYANYDQAPKTFKSNRPLRVHQQTMYNNQLTYRHHIIAGEMGTGKSLVSIEVAEWAVKTWMLSDDEVWYIGPKSGCKAVSLELIKWQSRVKPRMMTYDELVKVIKHWTPGKRAPRMVIFDESSKIKTHTTLRTQAAMHLTSSMIAEHKLECIIMLMSGTPAPKSPRDWWAQSEVSCPGFLKEGHPNKLVASLSLTEEREGAAGVYPHHITWLDDEKKCAICGAYEADEMHMLSNERSVKQVVASVTGFKSGSATDTGEGKASKIQVTVSGKYHKYEPSVNQVAKLYKRMRGLVTVVFKKDCLDLPEKEYRIVKVQPTVEMLQAARLIKRTETSVIKALEKMRELSDGFQYKEVPTGNTVACAVCGGSGLVEGPAVEVDTMAPTSDLFKDGPAAKMTLVKCDNCSGTGQIPTYERKTINVGSPKDETLSELLDQVEEHGRVILWGGFEGTINRLLELAWHEGWTTLKVDGKGWVGKSPTGENLNVDELLAAMDGSNPRRKELLEKYPKVAFVGNPKAGGMALTLTAAFMAIYYSNSFDGEARTQSEDRHHRMGMDTNRGCIVIDLICLPTDLLVLHNLQAKRRLELMTLGELDI